MPSAAAAFRRHPVSLAILVALSAAAQAQTAAAPAAAASSPASGDVQNVVVRASADASAGGLKAPYAGGQVARGGRVGILGGEDVMDAPFAITNYTQKLIQDQQAASIADVLQNDAGVRVARGFGNFDQVYIVRGLQIYSDDMSYNGLYGLLPRQNMAAELFERVEVLHGASAFINGAAPGGSGLGGAVNVSPKRAPNEPLTEVTVGTQTGGMNYEALDVARRFGDEKQLGLRLNVVNRNGETAVEGDHRKLGAITLGADFHTGGLRVSADIGYQDYQLDGSTPEVTIYGSSVPSAPKAWRQLGQPWTYSNERDTFGTLRSEYDFAPNLTGWVAGGFRSGHEDNSLGSLSVSAADGTDTTSRFDNARRDDVGTGEVGLRGKFSTGAVGHTVVASASLYALESRNAYAFGSSVSAGTIYEPTLLATAPAADSPVTYGGDLANPHVTSRVRTSSIALADTLSFLDDRLLLTIGARSQKIMQYSYSYYTGVANGSPDKASRVTPVGGIVFKASKQLSLYATYVEGLVAGDIASGNYNAGTADDPVSTPVKNTGQAFKPYQTKQVELGAKVDFGRVGGSFSVYESRKPQASVDDSTGYYSVDADAQRNRGAELTWFGEAMPGLRLLGGASYLDARDNVDHSQAIGAPKTQFNLGADWDVPGAMGLALEGRAVHTSSQYADKANTLVVPSWTRFDLGARYAFDVGAHTVTLRARVNNVANRSYWASAGGFPGYGYLTLGDPRTLVVSGTYAF